MVCMHSDDTVKILTTHFPNVVQMSEPIPQVKPPQSPPFLFSTAN